MNEYTVFFHGLTRFFETFHEAKDFAQREISLNPGESVSVEQNFPPYKTLFTRKYKKTR